MEGIEVTKNPIETGEKLSLAVSEITEARENEVVERLCRYMEPGEMFAYFGSGDNYRDRVLSALGQPDVWQMMEFSDYELTEQDLTTLTGIVGERMAEALELGRLGKMGDDLSEKTGGRLKHYRPFLLNPTDAGFSVNEPASHYVTNFLMDVFPTGQKKSVKDFRGNRKYVPFEPTYISTPFIFIEDFNVLANRNQFDLEAKGLVLGKEQARFLLDAVKRRQGVSELSGGILSLVEDEMLFDIPLQTVIEYLYAEKTFGMVQEKDKFFDELEKLILL